MAASKAKNQTTSVEIPECPVCLDPMRGPIFLCQSGHSLCNTCTSVLSPPNCPVCRQPMTRMRNRTLEELADKAKVQCPNHAAGCIYTLSNAKIDDHLKECIFRQMECPFGAVFGKCSWTGQQHQMMEHFKQKHPGACVAGDEVELHGVTLRECDRRLYLVAQQKLLFIITLKIDTLKRMAYWTVQLIGPKMQAHQHVYAIQVNSKQDEVRKVIFTEHCYSETVKVEDIIRQSNCAIFPLDALAHFIKDNKLSFTYVIRRNNEKLLSASGDATKNNANAPRSASCSRGNEPGPQGPKPKKVPWKKGPGHKGPGPKNNNQS